MVNVLKFMNIFLTKDTCYKILKIKDIFQKWGCGWYFCMKIIWVVNNIDRN